MKWILIRNISLDLKISMMPQFVPVLTFDADKTMEEIHVEFSERKHDILQPKKTETQDLIS